MKHYLHIYYIMYACKGCTRISPQEMFHDNNKVPATTVTEVEGTW